MCGKCRPGADLVSTAANEPEHRVLLLGGAPMSGKTTVARVLAAELAWDLVHIDDLAQAVRAVASEDALGALDPMAGYDWREYYLQRSADELVSDAVRAHVALWPAIKAVTASRASWGLPAVIEGWALSPALVRAAALPEAVCAVWLSATEDVFTPRVRAEEGFYAGASDEQGVISKFAARSIRLDEVQTREARAEGFAVVSVAGDMSVASTTREVRSLLCVAGRREVDQFES